jgi:hypothetical protein
VTDVHRNTRGKHVHPKNGHDTSSPVGPEAAGGHAPAAAAFSLVRVSAPRHGLRRQRHTIFGHRVRGVAILLVAAAMGAVALEGAHLALPASPGTTPAASTSVRNQSVSSVPRFEDTTPTTSGTLAVPQTTTTDTTVHIWPTTTAPGAVPLSPTRRAVPTRQAAPALRRAPVRTAAAVHATPTTAPVRRSARTIPLGDYAGDGDPSGISQFAAATGTHPALAADYLIMTGGWAAMDGSDGSENWMLSQWRNSGYRLVLGVPIIPQGSGASLAQGASGAYNQYFTTLAQTLVAGGQADAVLRLGWEFNGNWYPWSVASDTDAQNFAAYWRQIVDAMRAVPGSDFSFLWNPNNGSSSPGWDLALAYPGSAYVDDIGSDVYDEYWGTPFTGQGSWSNAVDQTWGLNWLVNFAAQQARPIAIPEWSVAVRPDGHGLGDDPYFVNQFAAWITDNNVTFTCMFSYNDTSAGQDDDITDGGFPSALAALRSTFG